MCDLNVFLLIKIHVLKKQDRKLCINSRQALAIAHHCLVLFAKYLISLEALSVLAD